jgi:hypothetical protein
MTLVGIGVLLDDASVHQLIEFRNRWLDVIEGPELDGETNIPHLALYELPVTDAKEIDFPMNVPVGTTYWTKLQHRGERMLGLTTTEQWMRLARDEAIRALRPHGEQSHDHTRHINFIPHVTIGIVRDTSVDRYSVMVEEFHKDFSGEAIVLEEVVLYETDDSGSLLEILV